MSTSVGVFRSRLCGMNQAMKDELGEIPFQKGLTATSRKEMALNILRKYGLDFLEIGTGTNRLIIKYDNFAVKIAIDREGIADNKQEWAICTALTPHVAYAHEISSGGHLLVATYCPAFTSYSEMLAYGHTIKKILSTWSKNFLLGDVGLSDINYANWGLSPDGKPVCIDYGYIFPADMDLFKCVCGCQTMTFYDTSFTRYKCTSCSKVYEDRDLRSRISPQERLRLFQNVEGYELTQEFETREVQAQFVKRDDDPASPDQYESWFNLYNLIHGGGR